MTEILTGDSFVPFGASLTGSSASASISARTGFPVTIASLRLIAPGKPSRTLLQNFAMRRFVSPGEAFCSWMMTGMPRSFAATAPGPEA